MKEEKRVLVGPVLLLVTIFCGLLMLAWEFRPDPARTLIHVSQNQTIKHTQIVRATVSHAQPTQQPFKLAQFVPHLHPNPAIVKAL